MGHAGITYLFSIRYHLNTPTHFGRYSGPNTLGSNIMLANNDTDIANQLRAFYLRVHSAFDSLTPDQQTEFSRRFLVRPLVLALTTLYRNRSAFPGIDLAIYPGSASEPAPIILKRAVLTKRYGDPGGLGLPAVDVQTDGLATESQRYLNQILGSSQDIARFLAWFLSQREEIKIHHDQAYISRFRPYRMNEEPEGLPTQTQQHIRKFEWGFMEVANETLPEIIGDPEPIEDLPGIARRIDQMYIDPHAQIDYALYIWKAIGEWIWRQLLDSDAGRQAFAYYIPNRAGAIELALMQSETVSSTSLQLALRLIDSPQQMSLIGVLASGEGLGRGQYLTRDMLQFILQIDASRDRHEQNLLLNFNPEDAQKVWVALRDTFLSLERACVTAAILTVEQLGKTISDDPIQSAFKNASGLSEKARVDALKTLIPGTCTTFITQIAPVFTAFPGGRCADLILLCDKVMDTLLTGPISYFDDFPVAFDVFERYEEARIGHPSARGIPREKTAPPKVRRIYDLIGITLVEDATITEQQKSLDDYPYSVAYRGVRIKNPPTWANLDSHIRSLIGSL